MRRKDREVTDPEKIAQIIDGCHCCRLGFCDRGRAYIVPLSFGYDRREDGGYTFYFHSAAEGRKIGLIARNGYASFEMDTHYRLNGGPEACDYSARFQSVMGGGRVSFVENKADKAAALTRLMEHTAGPGPWTYDDAMLDLVCIFRLDTDELSCKEHL